MNSTNTHDSRDAKHHTNFAGDLYTTVGRGHSRSPIDLSRAPATASNRFFACWKHAPRTSHHKPHFLLAWPAHRLWHRVGIRFTATPRLFCQLLPIYSKLVLGFLPPTFTVHAQLLPFYFGFVPTRTHRCSHHNFTQFPKPTPTMPHSSSATACSPRSFASRSSRLARLLPLAHDLLVRACLLVAAPSTTPYRLGRLPPTWMLPPDP